MPIAENYKRITDKVAEAARSAGKNPEEIKIVAVSKTFPVESMIEALAAGAVILGENRIQEAKAKRENLSGEFEFHLVGHLQSNKAKEAVQMFDLIHSIDSVRTAECVNKEAAKIGKTQKILLEVNTSGEESKFGISPEETVEKAKQISSLRNLSLMGLMTVGPLTDNEADVRRAFALLAELRERVTAETGLVLQELSMGMSSDFPLAIAEGSTMVRVGSAIFGNRTYT